MSRREIDLNYDGCQPQVDCHLMPCKIEDDLGKLAKTREYFVPTIRKLETNCDEIKESKRPADYVNTPEDPILLASFRGRPLHGRAVKVPAGFHGHVITKDTKNSANKAMSHMHFREFTYWNWDELPSKDDATVKALSWLKVAKAIHDPIDD